MTYPFQVAIVRPHTSKVERSNHISVDCAMSTYQQCLKMYPGCVAVVCNLISGKIVQHSDRDPYHQNRANSTRK